MFFQDALYVSNTEALSQLRNMSDKLNAKVVEQVNDSQELVMMSSFMKESNEYLLKKCLQERISDVASWRWVLVDLEKRLDDSIEALKHESKALHVVVQRIDDEIIAATSCNGKPGALYPLIDSVEEAIIQELEFLREEKKRFENLIPQIDRQRIGLEKTKRRIGNDALNKCQTISIDEACCHSDISSVNFGNKKTKKKRCLSLVQWEKHCLKLKNAGINALRHAVVTRLKIRATRVQLSITAQAYGTRVDSALRRRLHSNILKLQDLDWQRTEIVRDFTSLDTEMVSTEKSLLDTMDRQKVVEARLADRTLRPVKEHTADQVSYQLHMELGKLRKFINDLRINLNRIISLQNHLSDAVTHIDCCVEDITHVVRIDQERLQARSEDETATMDAQISTTSLPPQCHETRTQMEFTLEAIKEENEDGP